MNDPDESNRQSSGSLTLKSQRLSKNRLAKVRDVFEISLTAFDKASFRAAEKRILSVLQTSHLCRLVRHIIVQEAPSAGDADLQDSAFQDAISRFFGALSRLVQAATSAQSLYLSLPISLPAASPGYEAFLVSIFNSTLTTIEAEGQIFCNLIDPSFIPDIAISRINKLSFSGDAGLLHNISIFSRLPVLQDLTVTNENVVGMVSRLSLNSLPGPDPTLWHRLRRLSLRNLRQDQWLVIGRWLDASRRRSRKDAFTSALNLEFLELAILKDSDEMSILPVFSSPALSSLSIHLPVSKLDFFLVGVLAIYFPALKEVRLHSLDPPNQTTNGVVCISHSSSLRVKICAELNLAQRDLAIAVGLHKGLEILGFHSFYAEEGPPLYASFNDGLSADLFMALKQHTFSRRVDQIGFLEIATGCPSLRMIEEKGGDHEYIWEVARRKGEGVGKDEIELKPRNIEMWRWGGREN